MASPHLQCHQMDLSSELRKREHWRAYLSHAIILLLGMSLSAPQHLAASTMFSSDNTTDHLALLSFKSLVYDSLGALESWNTTLHFCQWRGVACGEGKDSGRVIALELESLDIAGSMTPHLANLTFLRRLHLSRNQLQGPIPHELGGLLNLQSLNLSYNSLDGQIPKNLSRCSSLLAINLSNNILTGGIPAEFGSLSRLKVLNLGGNSLVGAIPASLGNISALNSLLLYDGGLDGSIPDSIGQLRNLKIFQVTSNKLSGTIPPSLFNASSIKYFTAGNNSFVGTLPPDMFQSLPNLQMLILDRNKFHGPIPASLSNASKLVEIDLQINNFNGRVPSNLGSLQKLYWMNLNSNWLDAKGANGWDFLTSLTNCSSLGTLGLSNNRLGGSLPSSVANLSLHLDLLAIGENQISGSIPDGLGNLANLTVLILNKNLLTGSIPASVGRLLKLHVLALSDNKFDGQIPHSIGNLTQLNQVDLRASGLGGSIPASIGNCTNLEILDLSQNVFTGYIPKELLSLASLSRSLDLSNNFLVGPLPIQVGILRNLAELDVSENRLSGEIPSTLGDCQSLERLYMQHNFFQGAIPQALSSLRGLQDLDLSGNNLSGNIPDFVGRLGSLLQLNLSFNNIEGEVPKEGIFRNASAVSVTGNKNLCGGIPELHLPTCYTQHSRKSHISLALKVVIPLLGVSVCFIMFLFILLGVHRLKERRKRPSVTSSVEDQFTRVSYAELLRATNGFSTSNLIGVGSFGSVYKGIMNPNDEMVAVKVLDLEKHGASKSFTAECEALRYMRHRNLVKIITACSSVDFQGNEFKAVVLKYMPKGSLETWLHPEVHEPSASGILSLVERLNIAIDVASALDYLHHHGHTPVVHCDLKPSNVLLDDDMCAHVSDFGLAKFSYERVPDSEEHLSKSFRLKGTVGYVPPEYGSGRQISTYGDVYSYGILLLELFTGKRPTDDIFSNGLSLRKYVDMAFPKCVLDIVDHSLFLWEDDQSAEGNIQNKEEAGMDKQTCLVSIMRIGLSCSTEDPRERMNIEDVIKKLQAIRDILHRIGNK